MNNKFKNIINKLYIIYKINNKDIHIIDNEKNKYIINKDLYYNTKIIGNIINPKLSILTIIKFNKINTNEFNSIKYNFNNKNYFFNKKIKKININKLLNSFIY